MTRDQLHFLLLNIGHFLDHLFLLIFATVAALVLTTEWGMAYSQLIPYATPGLVAFGLFSLPAGWPRNLETFGKNILILTSSFFTATCRFGSNQNITMLRLHGAQASGES